MTFFDLVQVCRPTFLGACLTVALVGCASTPRPVNVPRVVYPKSMLDHPLRQPEYPPELRARGEQGVVGVDVLVNVDGSVKDARILMSSGHPPMDAATLKEARTWRFEPGQINGRPAAIWSTFFITFSISGGAAMPDQKQAMAEAYDKIEQRRAELEAQAAMQAKAANNAAAP